LQHRRRKRPGLLDSGLRVGDDSERQHASTTSTAALVDALGSMGTDLRHATAPPTPIEAGSALDGVGGNAKARSESARVGHTTGRMTHVGGGGCCGERGVGRADGCTAL
jgi:hypothetical protein